MECSKTTKEEYFPDYSSSRFGILDKSQRMTLLKLWVLTHRKEVLKM